MKILIATDGSEFSTAAIEHVCRIAIRPGDEVLILSGYEDAFPIAAEPFAISTEYYQKLEDSMNELTDGFLSSARKQVEEKFPGDSVIISTEIFRGSPAQEIVEKAESWRADLIVVGSHGRGFWGRLLGSVSNSVVHHAPCNVLVVRKPK
jgi:nucleotide-binding universal stress UspA family protein